MRRIFFKKIPKTPALQSGELFEFQSNNFFLERLVGGFHDFDNTDSFSKSQSDKLERPKGRAEN